MYRRILISGLTIGAAAVVLAGCKPQTPAATSNANANLQLEGSANVGGEPGDGTMMKKKQTVTVQLAAQNNSGQTGTATLQATEDGKTNVRLTLTAGTSAVQPVHIHTGACPTPGAVKYPLTSLTAGKSETTLNVSLDNLLKELPLAINAHKSTAEVSVYVACGNIATDGAMMEKKEDGAMMKKEENSEDAAIDAELNAMGDLGSDAELNEMEKEINAE